MIPYVIILLHTQAGDVCRLTAVRLCILNLHTVLSNRTPQGSTLSLNFARMSNVIFPTQSLSVSI